MGSGEIKGHYFSIIDELHATYPLSVLLKHASLSKSGYYKWRKRSCSNDGAGEDIEGHILAIHSIRPFYGYRRMTVALHKEGFVINHKRVYRIMKKLGIQSVIRKKRNYFGRSGGNIFTDLLKRNFTSSTPGKKFVTDITYIQHLTGFIYLSAIQDLYNNEIVAYAFSRRNNLDLVFATLKDFSSASDAILHSDQGFQYIHKSYQQELENLGVRGSHSRKGNCLDNACMESFFSHLKTEVFSCNPVSNAQETMRLVEEYIRFYNTERFQRKLSHLSPVEYRERLAA